MARYCKRTFNVLERKRAAKESETQRQQELIYGLISDNDTKTIKLFPMIETQRYIKLTKKTAESLTAILNHQIQKW